MLELGPIANTVKSVQPLPPQAQPSVAEDTKPVPESETQQAVPPLPSKGGEPGLGEHLDVYDTEAAKNPAPRKAPAVVEREAKEAVEEAGKDAEDLERIRTAKEKPELLGKAGLPQPTTDPPKMELPFLKPLGHQIGKAIDARG